MDAMEFRVELILISENIFLDEMEFGVQLYLLAGPFFITTRILLHPNTKNWAHTNKTEKPVKFATPHDTEPNQYLNVFGFWFGFHSHTIRYRTVARANTHPY